jgi:hypothetical protein
MHVTTPPRTPAELRDLLCKIVPTYRTHWEDSDNPYISEDGTFSFHGVMIDFTQYFGRSIDTFSEKQMREIGDLINAAVADDSPLENAVSTCLLEHLRQIKASKKLAPFLSSIAKGKSHA